jgi:hypothetical protein
VEGLSFAELVERALDVADDIDEIEARVQKLGNKVAGSAEELLLRRGRRDLTAHQQKLELIKGLLRERRAEDPSLPPVFTEDTFALSLLRERLRALHERGGKLLELVRKSNGLVKVQRERLLDEVSAEADRLTEKIRRFEKEAAIEI